MVERVAREPQWRGQRDASRRRILTLLGVSLLLHVPLTPIAALLGLLSLLAPETPSPMDTSEITAIPVSLLSEDELKALGGAEEPAPPPKAAEPAAPPPEQGADELFQDPAALEPVPPPKPKHEKSQKREDTPMPDGGLADKRPGKPADEEGRTPGDGGAPSEQPSKQASRGDPMALAGAVSSVADPNANVRLLVFNDRIREHPIGPRIGRLLSRLPQWNSFFGPTGVDPVRDIDRIMVFGPQLRESADVVAVLEYNVPQETMRRAIDGIVNREPKGKWLDSRVPAAEARADRAARTFVLAKPGMLLMVPPRLTDDALQKGPKLTLPRFKSDVAVVAFVATPWRVFMGFNAPVRVPESIKSAVIKVIPSADGGAVIEVEAVDESPETAQHNAQMLEQAINMATQQNLGALGALLFGGQKLQLLEPIKLTAEQNEIRGAARATPRQLDRILNFAESWLEAMENRARPRPPMSPDVPRPSPLRTAPAMPPQAPGTVPAPAIPERAPSPGAPTTPPP